jgi:chromosomal replication initiator protein
MKRKDIVLTKQDRRFAFEIFETVSNVTNVPQEDFIEKRSRKMTVVILRQISTYLLKTYTKLSQTEIGFVIGGYDHSTVIHSLEKVEHWLQTPRLYRTETEILQSCFTALNEKYGRNE